MASKWHLLTVLLIKNGIKRLLTENDLSLMALKGFR